MFPLLRWADEAVAARVADLVPKDGVIETQTIALAWPSSALGPKLTPRHKGVGIVLLEAQLVAFSMAGR